MNICNIIYILKNNANTKVYIGQTWQSIKDRWYGGYTGCTHLQRAIDLYGKNNFYYEFIMLCGTQETANYWEDYFIDKYKSDNPEFGYNLRKGGSRGKHSLETIEKIKESNKKSAHWLGITGENNPNFGKKRTEEQKKNISDAHKGYICTEEQKKKISDAVKGENHPFYGKHHTDETKEKISKTLSGRPAPPKSEETRKKMSVANMGENNPMYGIKQSPETIEKRVLKLRGQKRSDEVREKMSESASGKGLKLKKEDVLIIREKFATREITKTELMHLYHVSFATICDIIERRTWKKI